MASNSITNPAPNPMTSSFNPELWNDTTFATTASSSNYIGQVIMWGGPSTKATATLGSSWLICDGQAVSKTTYASLYEILGDLYGSTSTTFLLPSFLSSFPIGASDTTNIKIAYKGSNLNAGGDITIATAQLPSHNHTTTATQIVSQIGKNYAFPGTEGAVSDLTRNNNITTASTGSGQDFLPPFQCINFYIKAL